MAVCITIASKVNHDISLSIHEASKCERGDVTPHFEGPEESIIYDLLVQIGRVSEDSVEFYSESDVVMCNQKIQYSLLKITVCLKSQEEEAN